MVLRKLFQRYRKTEPTPIFIFRLFVLTLLLIGLIGYTWFVILGVYSDNPVTQNSLIEENSFLVPQLTLLIIGLETNITCNFKNANGIQDCTQYVTQLHSYKKSSAGEEYAGNFSAPGLLFSKMPNNGISSMEFNIYFKDPTINASDYYTLPIFTTTLLDAATAEDNYIQSVFSSQKDLLGSNSRLLDSFDFLNSYRMSAYNSYKFKLTRRRKDIMLQSWQNYMGFSSNLLKISYFTSTVALFLQMSIEQPTYTVQVETEKRNKTVISSIGLIGGAWGFAATIYALFFGTISIKPWGYVQKYGFGINRSVQTELKDSLECIPLVNRPKSTSLNSYDLKRRLDSLQLFLTEYVVDVRYFEEIHKSNVNKHKGPMLDLRLSRRLSDNKNAIRDIIPIGKPLLDEKFEAQSGIVYLPPYGGIWYNCTTDFATVRNQSISIKTVDYSLPVTAGLGYYSLGRYSEDRIQGIGFFVYSYSGTTNYGSSISSDAINTPSNLTFYCDTIEFSTTQCDENFKGLPSPDEKNKQWCISITNPFNNSQKVNVSIIPDLTSTNSNIITANYITNGCEMVNNINRNYFLLILNIVVRIDY
ncbi:8820_t:CDS:10 [Dentiscutata erythropus]|uniref:8820_t:CDS:1 n=1 Tax=Dentiscutata erythropus TaxID=1348616 RepID=A0A9N9BLY3_9GLOM|nr:8820_t:CDS:10 [Dentiscutata erythropus]